MIEPFIGDGDPDRRMVIELVVADLETERLEQHPQMLVRRIERQDLLGRAVALWFARSDPAELYRKEGKSVDLQIRERTRAIERYERAFEEGTMPEKVLADRVAELKEIREQLRGRKKEITAQLRARSGQRDASCLEGVSLGEFLGEVFEAKAERPAAKALFRLLIERIWIDGHNVRPIFRFPTPPGFVWPELEPPPEPAPRPGGDALGGALLQRYGDSVWGRFNWVMHRQPADWRDDRALVRTGNDHRPSSCPRLCERASVVRAHDDAARRPPAALERRARPRHRRTATALGDGGSREGTQPRS